jgi:hypothetical protein
VRTPAKKTVAPQPKAPAPDKKAATKNQIVPETTKPAGPIKLIN